MKLMVVKENKKLPIGTVVDVIKENVLTYRVRYTINSFTGEGTFLKYMFKKYESKWRKMSRIINKIYKG